jgi:hypothetical protein
MAQPVQHPRARRRRGTYGPASARTWASGYGLGLCPGALNPYTNETCHVGARMVWVRLRRSEEAVWCITNLKMVWSCAKPYDFASERLACVLRTLEI